MTTENRQKVNPVLVHQQHEDEHHLMDYVRILYKRRWIAIMLARNVAAKRAAQRRSAAFNVYVPTSSVSASTWPCIAASASAAVKRPSMPRVCTSSA